MRSLDGFKNKCDGFFGFKTPIRKQTLAGIAICLSVTGGLYLIYLDKLMPHYEVSGGTVVFLMYTVEICSCFFRHIQPTLFRVETTFQKRFKELMKINFMFIVPVLSWNQVRKSDLPLPFGVAALSIPFLYLAPGIRTKFGRKPLYLLVLKINLVLNAIVSARTTFYGVFASLFMLFGWVMKQYNTHVKLTATLLRVITSFMLYFTLRDVAVPKCVYMKARDVCTMSEEQCLFFKEYYSQPHEHIPIKTIPC